MVGGLEVRGRRVVCQGRRLKGEERKRGREEERKKGREEEVRGSRSEIRDVCEIREREMCVGG